jgi:hypothetical protein
VAALSRLQLRRVLLLLSFLSVSTDLRLIAQAQQPESLGDVARQLRAERAKDAKKATKIYTNDNLPAPVSGEPVTTMAVPAASAATSSKSASATVTKSPDEKAGNKASESSTEKIKTRDYWQARFRAARQDVANAKHEEQLSEDELNLLKIQQVREMDPIVKEDLTNKTEAKQSEVDLNGAALAAAQKALSELENQLKESGAPDDWSETE